VEIESLRLQPHSRLVLIINADDWGRSRAETNAALACHEKAKITSVSAMVFMKDSERAAEVAKANDIEAGLHLNFDELFTARNYPPRLAECHDRTRRHLISNKYAQLLYNPFLRREFSYSYQTQVEEFVRLFDRPPSHIDGHHHMHLCANVLLSNIIPAGTKMRPNFSFWPGEKSWLNRTYRRLIDRRLARRFQLPDYFFDLTQCVQENKLDRVAALAHPVVQSESEFLISHEFQVILENLEVGSYALV